MQRDPALRGAAIILFGIALMIFGATTPAAPTLFAIVGLVVATAGLIDALTDGVARR